MSRRIFVAIGVVLVFVAAACGGNGGGGGTSPSASPPGSLTESPSTGAPSPSETVAVNPAPVEKGRYQPMVPAPADFVDVVDNPYMPFVPGTTWVYEGIAEGVRERNLVVVTNRTKVILGVTTTVVHDQVFARGELAENTFDWYAQDRFGNVWYFGEDTAELEGGEVVSTKGTWEAGVDDAKPGVAMLGQPQVGETYRQEFYAGEAEDIGKVIRLDASVEVPFRSFDQVLVTEDTSQLEPNLLENKFYAPGVGVILERVIKGGQEVSRLVDMRTS